MKTWLPDFGHLKRWNIGNSLPGLYRVKNISQVQLRLVGLERSDWFENIVWLIRLLQTSVA